MSINCLVMVLFNYKPNTTEIYKALTSGDLSYVIFIDNSDRSLDLEFKLKKDLNTKTDKIIYFKNSKNVGLSRALNQGIKLATELKAEFIFILDQDANTVVDYFRLTLYKFFEIMERDAKIGALGPIVSNSKDAINHKFLFSREFSQVVNLINSGLLLTMRVVDTVGKMDEALFLGAIDTDYISRIIGSGLHVYRLNKTLIWQDFGETIHPSNPPLKILNILSRWYSMLMMFLGKSNQYLYWLRYYNDSQRAINLKDRETVHVLTKTDSLTDLFSIFNKKLIETFGGIMPYPPK